MEITRQPLSPEEKRKLVKTRNYTILVMSIMLAVTLGIAYSALSAFDSMFFPVLCFLIFFIGVQVFIVVIRIKQSQATEKTVYTGFLNEKKTHTSRAKNSSLHETYSVKLDDEWFTVEQHHFEKIHQGEKVSLHTVRNKQIIGVETIGATLEKKQFQSNHHYSSTEPFSEQITSQEKRILWKKLVGALFFRAVGGYFLTSFLQFATAIIIIALRNGAIDDEVDEFIFLIYSVWLVYILINIATIKLITDLLTGNTISISEQVTDKQISNSWKPTQNSVVSTRNYQNNYSEYYYVQTSRYWLSVSKEVYDSVETGGTILIRRSKLAKVLLDIRSQSKLNYR